MTLNFLILETNIADDESIFHFALHPPINSCGEMKVSLSCTASAILCIVGSLESKYCRKIGQSQDFVTYSEFLQPTTLIKYVHC